MIGGGADGGFLVFFSIIILALAILPILTAMTGGLIPILLGLLGIYGWIQAVLDFLKVLREANNYDELNKGMMDIILPLAFSFGLSKAVQGAGVAEYEEDLFILVINDILLTWFYGAFDQD